jgi:hypothetical protein
MLASEAELVAKSVFFAALARRPFDHAHPSR